MQAHMYVSFRAKVRGTRMQERVTAEARFQAQTHALVYIKKQQKTWWSMVFLKTATKKTDPGKRSSHKHLRTVP
jgi:hypothetical protein